MTDKAIQIIKQTDFTTLSQMADIATQSTYVKANKAQAMFIMLKGVELGLSPLQALDGINIIQGKPTISPQLMLALINRSGELEDMKIESTDTICTVTMKRKGRSSHTETFSIEDAKKMELIGKDNYKKQPKTMMKWRAVSACARIAFPDVIQGVYTPEEMGAEVAEDDSGDVVMIASPEPTPSITVTPIIMDTPPPAPNPQPQPEPLAISPFDILDAGLEANGVDFAKAANLLGIKDVNDLAEWRTHGTTPKLIAEKVHQLESQQKPNLFAGSKPAPPIDPDFAALSSTRDAVDAPPVPVANVMF